jgi:hypothetical protein
VLGLRVPNIASFGARVAGVWWPWMCPPAHLWFFSATTLPRLLRDCGFEVMEVRTLRGDGNNLYQYALMAAGNWLNDLRLRLRGRNAGHQTQGQRGRTVMPFMVPPLDALMPTSPTPMRKPIAAAQPPSRLLQMWLNVLQGAQPITDGLARLTRPLVEPLERRGWGDELLVYARRIR